MAKYRQLAGVYCEGGKSYGPGDVIETEKNLARWPEKYMRLPDTLPEASQGKVLNQPANTAASHAQRGIDAMKGAASQAVANPPAATTAAAANARSAHADAPPPVTADELKGKTLNELKGLAEDLEIDLKGAKSKEDVLKMIEEALS